MSRRDVFSFCDATGQEWHFDIQWLRASCISHPESWELRDVPICHADSALVIKSRGATIERAKAVPLSALDEPGIMLKWSDGTTLIVDGNHRLVKRVRRNLKTMKFWVTDVHTWSKSVLPTTGF